jgi:hypothetical protein
MGSPSPQYCTAIGLLVPPTAGAHSGPWLSATTIHHGSDLRRDTHSSAWWLRLDMWVFLNKIERIQRAAQERTEHCRVNWDP